MHTYNELQYRKATIGNANPVQLVITLHDVLIGDMRRALEALNAGDIERRTAELNHSFLVLQQLESSLDIERGGELAISLQRFFSLVRAKLLQAQITCSRELLQQQIQLVLEVRQAWQQRETEIASQLQTGTLASAQYAATEDSSFRANFTA